MTRISFIIPTFNRADYIGEAIVAILAQSSEDDEIIVIDDGSTDNTAAIVKAFGTKLRYYVQDNAGKSVALNKALGLADGQFIWICDDDDVLRPHAVPKLLSAIEETRVGFVFGRYTRFQHVGSRREDLGTGYWPDLSQGNLARHIFEDAFIMHNASLVKRSAYDLVGPFDETMLRSQDYDMFVRLATRVRCHYVDMIVFDQRKHPGVRGTEKSLHGAAQSFDVWNSFDRRIFERLADTVELDFYENLYASENSALLRRAAHLQRACVFARHDLWAKTLEDLNAAASIVDAGPLTIVESDICKRFTAGKHGFNGALNPEISADLFGLYRQNPLGRAIMERVLDGLIWRFKHGPNDIRRAAARLMLNVADASFPIGMAARKLGAAPPHAAATIITETSQFDPATLSRGDGQAPL